MRLFLMLPGKKESQAAKAKISIIQINAFPDTAQVNNFHNKG